jgi:hypothetical protein
MTAMSAQSSGQRPRRSAQRFRALGVATRSLHLVTMGLVLGGVAAGAEDLRGRAMLAATATGVVLLATECAGKRIAMSQGSGALVILKLALLGLAGAHPALCLPALVAATLVASVGAHMPFAWRHFSFVTWRVVPRGDPEER